jgi:hypothetical protein
MKKTVSLMFFLLIWILGNCIVITQWDFEAQTLSPSIGTGTISLIGNVTNDGFSTGYNTTYGWSTTNYPAQSTNNLTAGIYFEVSTTGYNYITLSWSHRHSNTSANRAILYYTLDKTASPPTWVQAGIYDANNGDTWFQRTYDGSTIRQLGSNPNLAFKIVSSFADAGNSVYMPSKTTSTYAASGKWRFDSIIVDGTPILPVVDITSAMVSFHAPVNSVSDTQSYSLNGYNLTSDLTVNAPLYFEIREQGTSTFSNSLSLTPTIGSISTTIEVRYRPTESGTHNGFISHSGNGFTTQDLSVSGTTILLEPTSHVTSFSSSNISYFQLHLDWVDSQGSILPTGYLIKGSKVAPDSITFPVDGVIEDTKKLTKYVVYGVQSLLIDGLDENQPYYFKIFPYTNSGSVIDYKTDGLVPLLSVSTIAGPIGTSLVPGDIAFVEYSSDSPDHFSFILLREITENTKINFTDKAWDGSALLSGEDIYYWRGTGRSYAAGEVIHIEEDSIYSDEGFVDPNLSGFSNNGDQILAFQGDTLTPSFIAGFSTTNWISSGVPTNNDSYLPVVLLLGDTALGFSTEIDNGCYNNIVTSGSPPQLREAINDPANWIRDNSLSNISFPNWNLVIEYASVSNIAMQKIDDMTVRISWSIPSGCQSCNLYSTTEPAGAFPGTWQVIQTGITNNYIDIPENHLTQKVFYRITAIY